MANRGGQASSHRATRTGAHANSKTAQLSLPFRNTWGGARRGAGRKPNAGRRAVPHRQRPPHRASEPVHVTLRSAFKPLRSQFVFPTLRRTIADANARARGSANRLTIAHFSIQFDHVHLLVEAPTRDALLRGVRGLAISIARRVNRLVFRRGRVFADRWHGRALTSPRAVRHALVYVLANFKKHEHAAPRTPTDPYSSAPFFTDFAECAGAQPPHSSGGTGPPNTAARTWLLRQGWQRHGRISIHESPRGR